MTKKEFLQKFQKEQELCFANGFQKWWTKFVFHYNDINNIVSILNSGKLYSRNKAKELGLLRTDIANDDVIANTNLNVGEYTRFYFGAKTPTLYNNEGLIPQNQIKNKAHCPVPVFLLFDFIEILSIENIYFSNGNMGAKQLEVYNDIKNLRALEWSYIYHREHLQNDGLKSHIIYCRNAEVLVKDEVDVYKSLKWICVRSSADKDTLFNLVDTNTKELIKDKIKIFTTDGLFHNHRTYLNTIKLAGKGLYINFLNMNEYDFTREAIIKILATGEMIHKITTKKILPDLYLDLSGYDLHSGIHFILKIDNHKIYDNILFEENEGLI